MTGDALTAPLACDMLFNRVNALFADYRCARGEEIGAYIVTADGGHALYRTIVNGVVSSGAIPPREANSLTEALEMGALAVRDLFPDHARQLVIWRSMPMFEAWGYQPEYRHGDMLIWPAVRAGWSLRMRLVGVDQ